MKLTKIQRLAMMKKNPEMAMLLEMERMESDLEAKLTDKILNNLRGKDGITPVKGKDYFTKEELSQVINYIRKGIKVPERGEAGIDGKDGVNGKDGYTPIAGKDYPTEEQVLKIIHTETASLFDAHKKKVITRDEVNQLIGKLQQKIDWKKNAQEIARAIESIKIEKQKLDYNALKNKPDIPTSNSIETKVRGIMRGGGDRIRVSELTGTGATKTFTVPAHKRALLVISTDFPILLKSTVDFTTSGTTLTMTDEVPTPSLGASIAFLYVE